MRYIIGRVLLLIPFVATVWLVVAAHQYFEMLRDEVANDDHFEGAVVETINGVPVEELLRSYSKPITRTTDAYKETQ